MTQRLTKAQLRKALGVETDAAVADFFEISRAAVAQWGDTDPIPELRQLQAERMRPGLADAMEEEQGDDVTGFVAGDVEAANCLESQGRADVHGVKAASVHARTA